MKPQETTIDQSQYLTFHLAGEEYAGCNLQVKEIITDWTLAWLQHCPPLKLRCDELRGNVVPVVDLAASNLV